MSDRRTAPKPYTCKRCETEIREGSVYARRKEKNSSGKFITNKYHCECEQ